MIDKIENADVIPQEFIDNYNTRKAILSELERQKAKNKKIVERQNRTLEKIDKTVKVDKSRVATQRIQEAEQRLAAIEALEDQDGQLAKSLHNGTLQEDLRDLEAEHNDKVQDALKTVLNKNNNERIAAMKEPMSDELLDELLEETPVEPEVIEEEHESRYIDGQRRLVLGTENIDVSVVDPIRYSKELPTPDIAKRTQIIKEKTGQIAPRQSSNPANSPYMPTTRTEMQQLLLALNINTNLQMTNKETADMLKTLLTCNETQLNALYTNAKLPVALKIIIKRIQQDIKNGNTETVERLWDRIFGKTGMSDPAQVGSSMSDSINNIIPGAPISREAYMLIRETIIDK